MSSSWLPTLPGTPGNNPGGVNEWYGADIDAFRKELANILQITSTPVTLTFDDMTVLVNVATGTINLPDITGLNGKRYFIIRTTSSAGTTTIDAFSSQTINGVSTKTLTTQWQAVELRSFGGSWTAVEYGGSGGVGNHNMLSSSHPDTLAAAVVQGDLIFGNATPAWARLAKGASSGMELTLSGSPTAPTWTQPKVWRQSSDPGGSSTNGDIWNDTSTGKSYKRHGGAWVQIATSNLAFQINEVADPGAAPANSVLFYAKDVDGFATLAYQDDQGRVVEFKATDQWKSRKDFSLIPSNASDIADSSFGTQMGTSGSFSTVPWDTTNRAAGRNIATVATIDTGAGYSASAVITALSMNPEFRVKFQMVEQTLRRLWIGLRASSLMALNAPTAAHIALQVDSSAGNTNFVLSRSTGGVSPTVVQLDTLDTSIHELFIMGDSQNSRWGYKWDNASTVTWVTSNIPGATTGLGFELSIRTLENAIKSFNFWWWKGTVDV